MKALALFGFLLAFDVISKELVVRSSLFHVFNEETELNAAKLLVLALLLVVGYLWRRQPWAVVGVVCLAAGGVGNFLYAGAVPDFILIPGWVPGPETGQLFPAPNSAANFADIWIWIGSVFLVIGLFRGRTPA